MRPTVFTCIALVTALFMGCAGEVGLAPAKGAGSSGRIWPNPPDQARIRYSHAFSNYADIGLKQPFFARLRDRLGGAVGSDMVRPYAIAVSDRLIAVADPGLSTLHVFDLQRGLYLHATRYDGVAFSSPVGVALADDRLFLADSVRNTVFVMDSELHPVASIEGLNRPTALGWDEESAQLFVAETLGHRLQVYDRDGNLRATIGERGAGDAQFNFPTHLAIADGLVHVNDSMNFRVQVLDTAGAFVTAFGQQGDEAGYLAYPKGLAVDSQGHVYVAEAVEHRIQIFERGGRYLMDFGEPGAGPGAFAMPAGLTMHEDRLYVCDSRNGRVQVFEYLREEEEP